MHQAIPAARVDERGGSIWRGTFAALCATLVGIGLARFAYTPLIPALIEAGWFDPSAAVYLGAANLAGYLAGAVLARRMTRAARLALVLRAMMLTASAAFFACAVPLSFAWFFLWRFASGYAGGALMVLAAPAVLPHVPAARRGLAGGLVFTGVGLGVAASGTLVPMLLSAGLVATWSALGVLSVALTLAGWSGWPAVPARPAPPRVPAAVPASAAPAAPAPGLRALYAQYGLEAVGVVPHMVFIVDFVARGRGEGLAAGARLWIVYGVGAMLGPLVAGRLADRIGFRAALRLAYVVQAAPVAWLALAPGDASLLVSTIVIGAFTPGIVPLALGRVQELAGPAAPGGWSRATVAFALCQAAAAYAYSALFASGSGYAALYAIASGAFVLALGVDVAAARPRGMLRP
jgi:predicted MFS family arabinose efflux permease